MGDDFFMHLALSLAENGRGKTQPNPMVGAVIVKKGKIVGRGWHKVFGGAHAEVNALRAAGGKAKGATMYVNLEPCCHFGKTGPCTKAIIAADIKKVVCAMKDPNSLVNGKGFAELREKGVKVKVGLLQKEAEKLNEVYLKFMRKKMPFVTLKLAMSADGKITKGGRTASLITDDYSRKLAHQMRAEVDAVVVGSGTIKADDPRLTVRHVKGKNPIRVVVDSKAGVPLNAKVLKEAGDCIVVCTKKAKRKRLEKLLEKGAIVLVVKAWNGLVDLHEMLKELAKAEISHVLIEGGARLAASSLRQKVVDKVAFFVAPYEIGRPGLAAFDGLTEKEAKKLLRLKDAKLTRLKKDFLISGYVKIKK